MLHSLKGKIATLMQRTLEVGLLTRQQAASIATGSASILDILEQEQVDGLVNSPVEAVAFCDEEGLR